MHLTAAGNIEAVGSIFQFRNLQRNILQRLTEQTVTQLTGSNELAFAACKGAVVDRESHFNGGGRNLNKGQRLNCIGGTDGVTDTDITDTAHGDDIAGRGFGNRRTTQTVKGVKGNGLTLLADLLGSMIVADNDFLILLDSAALNATDSNSTNKLVVIDGGNQHLEGLFRLYLGGGNVIQNGFKQRLQIGADNVGRIRSSTLTAGAEQHGRIKLILGGVQIQQKFQNLIHNLVDTLVGTIDLINHNDNTMTQLQSFAQNKTGLRHGAFGGIHQQNNAVDHLQNTFNLAAKVGVARGINNINFGVFILDSRVFCQNGNSALSFQVIGIHHAIDHRLILAVDTALFEHLIHQRRFTVVDVGNDSNISQIIANHCHIPPNIFFNNLLYAPF